MSLQFKYAIFSAKEGLIFCIHDAPSLMSVQISDAITTYDLKITAICRIYSSMKYAKELF